MSETRPQLGSDRPTGDERPTENDPPQTRERSVFRKAQRVPWPRRLIATGLLAAVLALVLHAFPRPYQPLHTGVVRGLGDAYGNLSASYANEVAALEPVAGEASEAERKAYSWELWRHRWFGAFKEILLRFSEWLAASCLFVSLALIAVERRRLKRQAAASGLRTAPTLLRHETVAGGPIPGGREPVAPAPAPVPAAGPAEITRPPLRETGDEVTPPSPTPVPVRTPGTLELRPAAVPIDDDDLARATDNQTPNLARLARGEAPPSKAPASSEPKPAGLPVFFQPRRDPRETHPVVHPGDAPPPVEPAPTPPPVAAADAKVEIPGPKPNDNPGWWPKPGDSDR